MSDLPNPAPGIPQAIPAAGAMSAAPAPTAHAQVTAPGQQLNVVEQVENIVAQTPTSPFDRANHIHALKSAYLQANHDVAPKDNA
ncbi:hypothetical protein KDA14_01875 [Candidatus Saccharibacteria bacterium]|nr:hypothetical protein [Candidatus Saccharibacteria bacterium]